MRKSLLAIGLALLSLGLPACTGFKRWSYEGCGRDRWQKPERVVQALSLPRGATVADLGAGGGYFTFRLADAVGPAGRVYAVDVDPDMLQYIAERSAEEGRTNVVVVRAELDDPKLEENSVDLIFTCNTYHHLANRTDYFARAKRVLRPGGRIAIIDLDDSGWLMSMFGHSTGRADIVREMETAGYRLEEDNDFLSRQSFLVFAAPPG